MAVDLEDGRLIDPTGGLGDLRAALVRAVGPGSLDDDPLRMLRAVRVAAELGMRLEAKTSAWIIQRASTLSQPAPERVRDELVRILAAPELASHLHMLDELDLLEVVAPEVGPLKEQAQSPPHRFDTWWHTLLVVEAAAATVEVLAGGQPRLDYVDAASSVWEDVARRLGRFAQPVAGHLAVRLAGGRSQAVLFLWSAFCHDWGKPLTCTEGEEGHLHFYGHERVGAEMAAERMEKLRFSRAEKGRVQKVVQGHLRPAHLSRVEGTVSRRAVYRYYRALESTGVEVALLSIADHLSTWGPNLEADRWRRRLEVVGQLLDHYFERQEEVIAPSLLVTGRDLMEVLGIDEGPEVGRLLEGVREAQAAGEIVTREEALVLAERMRAEKE
jgi:tRNA nucleotidyltransferase/poly(A) polymerase